MKRDYNNNVWLNDNLEYNTSADVEKQVVNLTYVDPPKPLYDPNNMMEGNVPPAGGMIVPMVVDLNNNNYAPPIVEAKSGYVSPNFNPKIREDKKEVNEYNLEVKEEKLRKSNRCCGCCPTSRKGKLIVLFIVLFFLGIIGILAFVFFPTAPDFDIGLKVNNDKKFEFEQNSFRIKYALDLIINVTNNNRYDIKSEGITIRTYISPDMTALSKTKYPGYALSGRNFDREVGFAEDVGQRIFPSHSTTSFNLTLNVNFTPDKELGIASDPAVGEILRVCSPEAIARNETLKIISLAYVEVGILKKLGINPKIMNDKNLGCPLGKKNAAELFKNPMLARFVKN
jgi:hypothetical protein